MEVRRAILSALAQFPIEISEDVIEELELRVREKFVPDRKKTITNFAYIVARNWAVDRMRRKVAVARRIAAAMLRADEDRLEQQRRDRCSTEFEAIVRMISPTLRPVQQKQIAVVRMRYFEQTGEEVPRKGDSLAPHIEGEGAKKRKKNDPFEELRKEDEAHEKRWKEIQERPDVRLARRMEGEPGGREGGGGGEGGSFRGG